MKAIKVQDKTWERIIRWKYLFGCKSVDEVIDILIKITPASEIQKYKEVNKK